MKTVLPGYECLATAFDAALLDLDGVCFAGKIAVEHAAEALAMAQKLGMQLAFMTNNAMRTAPMVAARLNKFGIAATSEQVVTCAQEAASIIAKKYPAGTKVLAVGAEGVIEALKDAGMQVVFSADDKPLVVMQGLAKTIDWSILSEAAIAIRNGAEFIATNKDSTLPTERGAALGNGSLVQAVVHATGVVPQYCGKPGKIIYEFAAKKAKSSNPLCVGDRLDTDIMGAVAMGYTAMHVITGINDARDVLLASKDARPQVIAKDLRQLNHYLAPVYIEQEYFFSENYVCWMTDDIYVATLEKPVLDDIAAKQVAEMLRLNNNKQLTILEYAAHQPLPQPLYRALAACVWQATDRQQIDITKLPSKIEISSVYPPDK